MTPNGPLPYQEIPQNKLQGKMLGNWSKTDAAVALVIILAAVATGIWTTAAVGAFVAIVLVPLLVRFGFSYGRLYSEIASAFRSLYRVVALHEIWWEPSDRKRGIRRWLRNRRPIPLRFSQIQATFRGERLRYGLIRQTDQPYDHLFIAADGGLFASADVNRQTTAVNELANITNEIAVQSDLKVGISYLRMTSPYNGVELASHLRFGMNPVIADPEGFVLDPKAQRWARWMHDNAEQITLSAATSGGSEVKYLIVITIRRAQVGSKSTRGVTDRQLYDLPIIELGRSLVDALSHSPYLGLRGVRCLGLAELARVVRTSWDVTGIGQYQRDALAGEVAVTDDDIDAIRKERGDQSVDDYLRAWPRRIIRSNREHGYIVFDDNYVSTLRITQLPEQIRTDEFMNVHHLPGYGTWTRVAMVGQSVSGDSETRMLILGQSAMLNFESAFFGQRLVRPPKMKRRQDQLSNQAEVISTNSVSQYFNMLVTVVAGNEEELLNRRKQIQSAFGVRGFRIEVVRGVDRQRDAAISGMLGINRL